MRIIKEGNKKNYNVKFVCNNCGCEFECNTSEYWTDNSVKLTYPPQYTRMANCPCCHKICKATTSENDRITVLGDDIINTLYNQGVRNERGK